MSVLSGRLANLTPERLGSILNLAEMGHLRDWADLCDRMVEVDATVRASFETRVSAVAGARCIVEVGASTGDPARDAYGPAAAQFFERVLDSLPDWPTRVTELLDGIAKGIGVLSVGWEWDGHAVMPDLRWVHARRFRWWRPDWSLRLVDDGETQHQPGLILEPDAWLVHAPKTVAGYPTRVGVMRAVAWPYLFKRWCLQFWMTGAERFAWPLMWAKVPRGAAADVRGIAQAGLDALSSDHSAVVEDPVAFQLLETTVKDNGTWSQFSNALNAEIGKAILGMTDMNEPGRIGAYAAVEVRRGTTVDARIAMDELALASTVRTQFAEAAIRFNTHLFGGLMPPIPSARWVISAKRSAIPAENTNDASLNERRRSIDLDPVSGGDMIPNLTTTPASSGDGADSAKIATSIQAVLASVKTGDLTPAAAKLLVSTTFPTLDAVAIAQMVDAQAGTIPPNATPSTATQADPAPLATTEIAPGSQWTDTEDGHRLEVVKVADGAVYFVDLDDRNPARQWRYAIRTFLERARAEV